jgi:hypothetical protein
MYAEFKHIAGGTHGTWARKQFDGILAWVSSGQINGVLEAIHGARSRLPSARHGGTSASGAIRTTIFLIAGKLDRALK